MSEQAQERMSELGEAHEIRPRSGNAAWKLEFAKIRLGPYWLPRRLACCRGPVAGVDARTGRCKSWQAQESIDLFGPRQPLVPRFGFLSISRCRMPSRG